MACVLVQALVGSWGLNESQAVGGRGTGLGEAWPRVGVGEGNESGTAPGFWEVQGMEQQRDGLHECVSSISSSAFSVSTPAK